MVIGQSLLHRADEPIAQSRQSFYVPRRLGGILQRLAQSFDRRIDAVIELNDCPVRPELLVHFLARNQLARMFQ